MKLYSKIGRRNTTAFTWMYDLYQKTPMSSVSSEFLQKLALTKIKLTILDALMDDIADTPALRDKELLNSLLNLPWEPSGPRGSNQYYLVSRDLWLDIFSSVRSYPRFDEFSEIFYFDLKQAYNSVWYSWLVNTFSFCVNFLEKYLYGYHGNLAVVHGMLDIMCSPNFDRTELGITREMLQIAERVSGLINMLHTYPREIQHRDLSPPIVTYAISRGIVTREEFMTLPPEEIRGRLRPLEAFFRKLSEKYIQQMERRAAKILSFDARKYVEDRKGLLRDYIPRITEW